MKTLDTARNNVAVLAIVAILSLGSLFMLANPLNLGAYDPPSRHGRVTHLVMFQFKDTAATDAIEEDTCIDPVTQNPYIRSLAGGKSNSIEGMQNGVSYAFVVEFDSLEKRDYYVKTDPSHQAFLQGAGAVLEKAIVVDFADGVF